MSVHAEREEPIAPAPFDAGSRVAGSPLYRPVDDGWPGVHRAERRVSPQISPGRSIQREELILIRQLRHRGRVQHAVGDRDWPEIPHSHDAQPGERFELRIGCLPDYLPVDGSSAAHDPPVATVFDITPSGSTCRECGDGW